MKITTEHYNKMKEAIFPLAFKIPEHREWLEDNSKCHDLEKRLRWDMARAAGLIPFFCDTLYKIGVNDDHIDTALKKIIKECE